jgi:ferredoxin-NADP reductase/ferredoxin
LLSGGSHKVRLIPGEQEFVVEAGQVVLEAALKRGVSLRYGCRRGRCSSCKYRVLKGDTDRGAASPYCLSEMEREEGWALLCCATPLSDLVIVDQFAGGGREKQVLVPQEFKAVVTIASKLSRSLWQLRLSLERGIEFYPGQFIELQVPNSPGQWRAYSIANSPLCDRAIELIVKEIQGGAFSGSLSSLSPGKECTLRGPYGSSYLRDGDSPVLLVGTGSGIAPLLSILRHAEDVQDPREFLLVYGAKSIAEVPFADQFDHLKRQLRQFDYVLALSADSTRPQSNRRVTTLLQHLIDDASCYDAYLCGRPDMCDSVALLLEAKGLNDERMFVDRFYPTGAE